MSFIDERLPVDVEKGVVYGSGYDVNIFEADSGLEQRNLNRQDSRAEGDAAYGVLARLRAAGGPTSVEDIVDFWHVMGGMTHSWRFKNHTDFQIGAKGSEVPSASTAQDIGLGDDVTTDFQVFKRYVRGSSFRDRIFTKLVAGTFQVYKDNVLQTETTHYTLDLVRGLVKMVVAPASTGGTGPGGEEVISINGEVDDHVRFNTPLLQISLVVSTAGQIPNLPIIEVLENGVDPL